MDCAEMFVLACLGNPGRKYARNRHNIGFMVGEYLADRFGIAVSKASFGARAGKGAMDGREVLLLFPLDFMNNSGGPVRKALDYYRVPTGRLVVVHDDIELSFGTVKAKYGGGHKGHNGIRSISAELGTADFHRIRFGVGRPENEAAPVADFVLSDFTAEERERIREFLPIAAELIAAIMASAASGAEAT
jgi:PTH1 family peptidyl-tRNA hydrolase